MPKVCKSGIFSDKEIQCINYCRMYLNVTTLADIVLADGTTLDPRIYQGQHSLLSSQLKHMEIHQECPSEQSWQLWHKAMTLWTKTMKLEKPLGRWCKTRDELDQRLLVYFDHDDYALYLENTDWSPTSRHVPVKEMTQDSA
eukprot:11022-Ditylum_brightwellii.AAC.1